MDEQSTVKREGRCDLDVTRRLGGRLEDGGAMTGAERILSSEGSMERKQRIVDESCDCVAIILCCAGHVWQTSTILEERCRTYTCGRSETYLVGGCGLVLQAGGGGHSKPGR